MKRLALRSLRLRLILGSAAAVVLAMILAGLFMANLYRLHTTERFRSELDHHYDELVELARRDGMAAVEAQQPLSDPLFNTPGSGLYWQIERPGETPLLSPSLEGIALKTRSDQDSWTEGRRGELKLIQRSAWTDLGLSSPALVTLASTQDLLDGQIADFRLDLTLSIVVIGLTLLIGAAALVRFGLAPVRRLGDEVDQLRRGQKARLDLDVPPEFAPLVERLNAVLDGQAQVVARARTESGNLAHHLRTPLALITDEAEQLRLSGDARSADFLLEQCEAMRRHMDYHLARAAAAGTRSSSMTTPVAPLIDQILAAMRRLHADRKLTIRSCVSPGASLPCDSGDLAEIVSNLVDNACKWATSTVIVIGSDSGIEIRDDGPGVPEDQRAAVFNVGMKLDKIKPGSGLGLSAARDLLDLYDARLDLDAAPEGGLNARILFGAVSSM